MRWMRILLAVSVAGLAGCARTRPPPSADVRPQALLIAFADDFHSGVIIERSRLPADLLPAGAPDPSRAPWIVLHFGERRWITGEADSTLDAVRLVVATGEGGVQIDTVPWWIHERGGTVPEAQRVWPFAISAEAEAAMLARLRTWIDGRAMPRPLRPGSSWLPSSRAWSLGGNCHDFTRDLLDAAGLPVAGLPINWAFPLRGSLDRTWADAARLP
jgi:hypothetical protein